MLVERLSKRFLKSTAIVFGSILILLTAFHFWFVAHAEELLQNLVATKSKGKLKLEVGNFSFNWLSKKMELKDAVLYTTDTATAPTAYRFAVKEIKLKVRAILPMIFEKTVLINLLNLQEPDIVVTRLQAIKKEKDNTTIEEDFSIPREMGKIYNSIQDALAVLKVKKFEIENARVTLNNRIKLNQVPIVISHIDFHIDNLKVDSSELSGDDKIFFSDNIVLKSRDQSILFPNGRHRLSFRKFRINIEKKIVEFDSCTIAAVKTDSSTAAFSVYFDALMLTNIDFDTLYRAEVIKADSVYCTNPHFKLDVDIDTRTGKRKAPPKLDQIIQQLTGDLELNFVVVQNASFDINTKKNDKVNSFSSQKNNFEIQGLRIDKEAERALKVEKFALAIRNYENFLRDSTYEIQFDSVIFNNNQIFLSSFSFKQLQNGRVVKSFIVPRFHLTGLSWDDLLFDQKFRAQEATLYNPVIKYIGTEKKRKSSNIFDAIAAINDVMMLENLNIIKGNIDMQLNGNIQMKLQNATLSVESKTLLGSNQLSGIRRSVNQLDFNKGFFRFNDLTVLLNDISYTGPDSRLKAATAVIFNSSKSIDAIVMGVAMDEIFINENNGDVNINGVEWREAKIKIGGIPSSKQKKNNSSLMHLKKIRGNNTQLQYSSGNKTISAFIDHISAWELFMKPGEKPRITELSVTGKAASYIGPGSRTRIESFELNDLNKANLKNIHYTKTLSGNITDIRIPEISFLPNIHSIIHGDIIADEIIINQPVISINADRKDSLETKKNLVLPRIKTNKLLIQQPEVHFSQETGSGAISMKWTGNRKGNSILLMDAGTDNSSFFAKQLHLSLNHFIFTNATGKNFDAGKGEVSARVNDISFQNPPGTKADWNATLATLDAKNFVIDSIGKQSGTLDIKTLQLKELALSSSFTTVRKVIKENTRFRIGQITGGYVNNNHQFRWFNAEYDKGSKVFTLDSFAYRPALDQDSFVITHPYQTDYIRAKTGRIRIGPFDIDKYLKDTIVSIGTLTIDDAVFNDFRDNRSPFKKGIIKPLMVDRIKSIPFKLSIDNIEVNKGDAEYTEVNPKTGLAGVVPVTRMTMRIFPVRNYDLVDSDSLRIQVNGYVLDSIWFRLRLRESYLDTLSGFLFTLRMMPADLKVLNPVLGPLASVKLRSGYLDTLSMRVAGHEYFAYGEMEMLYHDLKVQILANGNPHKKKLITALMNFIANSFIIKNKNTERTGNVYFLRDRERSALNYLIKIAMSGMSTSVGAKSNKKMLRKYKKELRQRDLPTVDFE